MLRIHTSSDLFSKKLITRFSIFRISVYAGLICLGLGLFRAQLLMGAYFRNLSEQNRIRLVPSEAPRGRVFDSKGNLLATNRPSYDVVAIPEDITPAVISRLGRLLGLKDFEVRKRLTAPREYPFAPAVIKEDISRTLAFQIEERRPELPGVSIRVSFLRSYPYKETASHLIGYIGKISPEEYQWLDHKRYGLNSLIGRMGIERIFDEKLRGMRGGRQMEVNARGELIKVISERMPEPGEDIILTLDLEFQSRIMDLIRIRHASVAVLDLASDSVLVLASSPAFDPNVFVAPGNDQIRLGLIQSEEAPLLDRGVGSAYPPGSVFKLVTALTALETGKITPETRFYCKGLLRLRPGGRPYRCWRQQGHGSLNLYEAIERSCNVYFYNVAKRVSPDDIAHYARQLGLGERMRLEVLNIAPGLVPDSIWKKERFHDKWYQGETLSYAIGQSYLLVSPIQMLRLVAIIAKNGIYAEPHLVMEDTSRSRSPQRVAIREENLKAIKRGMIQVVESDYGTGQLARVDFNKMAGKTGTAQSPPKEPHSWMTGFFPATDPQIAFVVFVEHGGSGGITSAKIVKEMLHIWKELYVAKAA
ncbi:MAG: penicillin-binding protein 2 [Candidatus Omnitrophica bacterium]|nr:penicillin-binding protein 2 [Candidatus Omnitrophota bacterium]